MINEFNEREIESLISAFAKLPLFARTILYLASGASRIGDPFSMNHFAETGKLFPGLFTDDEKGDSVQAAV